MKKHDRNRQKHERRISADKQIAERVEWKPAPGPRDAAKQYLKTKYFEPNKIEFQPDAKISDMLWQLVENRVPQKLVRLSRQKYLECLELPYALMDEISRMPDREAFVARLRGELKCKPKSSTNLLNLVLQLFIDYGTKDGRLDPAFRRLISRDNAALMYLKSQNVPVGGICEYQKKHGDGVDEWQRKWQRRRVDGPSKADELEADFPPEDLELPPPQQTGLSASQRRAVLATLEAICTNPETKSAIVLFAIRDGEIEPEDYALSTSKVRHPARLSRIWMKTCRAFQNKSSTEKS